MERSSVINPESQVETGSIEYHWADTIWGLVENRARTSPDSLLVSDEKGRRLTAAQFRDRAERVAAGLQAQGVAPGAVVSWQLPSNIEAMLLFTALARLGAVQNPLIMMLREGEVEFITRQAGAELLIVPPVFRKYEHGPMAERIAERIPGLRALVLEELPEGDPATLPPTTELDGSLVRWLYYTSGTTAEPKGAKHTDQHIIAGAQIFCAAVRPLAEDHIASVAPIAHVGGVLYFLSALVPGGDLIITEVFDPVSTTKQLSEADVTLCGSGVPFIQGFLAQQRLQPDRKLFPNVKAFLVGGASRVEALHYQAKDELGGVGIISGYGMTESPFMSWGAQTDSDWHHAFADGQPGEGIDLRIVREDGTLADPGESGEIRLTGATLMSGYVDSTLDAKAFDENGYFKSGDLGYLDAEGFLVISGRIKDVIIRNMENISAREVEIPLIGHPQVLIATVIGLPDEMTGERVCAVVVPADPADPPTLESICAHLVATGINPRKLPVQLEILPELPLNAMGKVMKQVLQKQYTPESAR